MSEVQPQQFEGKTMHFEIGPPLQQDNDAIGQVHLQAWLETYQNPELGVDEAWIRETMGHVAETTGPKNGHDFRKGIFDQLEAGRDDLLYLVPKDEAGKVVGFCVGLKLPEKEENVIEALYLLKITQGQGLGSKLMREAIEWLGDDKPIKVSVVSYNQPAIDFYKRYGFEIVPDKVVEFKGPVTAIDMIRPA